MISIILIAAQSIDGFIARHAQRGTDFCSAADRRFLSQQLKSFDAMIMGRKTFETLQDRITGSTSAQFMRKICTTQPKAYAQLNEPGRIEFTSESPAAIRSELKAKGRRRCALLGGGETYARFLQAGCVDELWLTIEPKIFGQGTPLAAGKLNETFQLLSHETMADSTLLLKYRPRQTRD